MLPREMGLGPKAIVHLRRCVYGTRDAGMIREGTYTEALINLGFWGGLASPLLFLQPSACRLSCHPRG